MVADFPSSIRLTITVFLLAKLFCPTWQQLLISWLVVAPFAEDVLLDISIHVKSQNLICSFSSLTLLISSKLFLPRRWSSKMINLHNNSNCSSLVQTTLLFLSNNSFKICVCVFQACQRLSWLSLIFIHDSFFCLFFLFEHFYSKLTYHLKDI